MGTLIKTVSVVMPRISLLPWNSIKMTARAASRCLENAGINPSDLGLLINTGIYRYRNTGEPAIAALVLKAIRARKRRKKALENPAGTFSFDLNNGGCGLLTGIEIIHTMMNNDEISYGMVVTGDSEPFYGLSEKFDFSTAAAAIILSKSNDFSGFKMFRTYNYPEYSGEFSSCTSFSRKGVNGKRKNVLRIMQKSTYTDSCVKCAVKSLYEFLDESGKRLDEIDLIISSQSPGGFINGMKNYIGNGNKIILPEGKGKKVLHTAGPAFALKKAFNENRFMNSGNIIFLTVGSGISVSITLYTN
ncbi:MAG: hypothetical protein V1903_06265 [Bacteroidota bacterium]